jgi:hypothetical protein
LGAHDIITLLENGGAIIVFIALFISGQVVRKGELDEMRKQRDDWKAAAELNQRVAEQVLDQGSAAKELFTAMKRVALEAGKAPDP